MNERRGGFAAFDERVVFFQKHGRMPEPRDYEMVKVKKTEQGRTYHFFVSRMHFGQYAAQA